MSQSEETPVPDTTPTDSTPHLGLQSPDPDSTSSPDLSPYDLNHSAVETEHEESSLQQQLQNLDLKEEEEETDRKDDGERESNNDADGNAAEDEDDENEEERNDNEIDGENVKQSEGKRSHYPVRPDAESCAYYMKTGLCKFGSNCKFNHPIRRTTQAVKEKVKEEVESTEKPSQTELLPKNWWISSQGEKECPYYMRNGSCKYGANCRFNHPDPTAAGACDPTSRYGNGGSVSPQAASQVNMVPWSSPRALNETAAYIPIMFSPPQVVPPPNPEWNGYQATVYPPPERSLHPAPAYVMNNPATETAVYTHNQPQMVADEFPARPGQPECSYFLKTGDCKFKSNCKYHHPKNRVAKMAPCVLSDKGLPLRPDQTICSHYSRYGICKFGPACKFDHSKQEAPSTMAMAGLDQPPPFSHSAATEQTGIASGTDTAVQQPV